MADSKPNKALPIVVGVDGSPESVLALRWAKRLAEPLGTTIKAVSAWRSEVVFAPYSIPEWDSETVVRELHAKALVDAFGNNPPAGLVSECLRGQSAQVLIEAAMNAQMLIVGSRGHGGFKGMLLGSVSSACAAHAKCAVLVVHEDNQTLPEQVSTGMGTQQQDADNASGYI